MRWKNKRGIVKGLWESEDPETGTGTNIYKELQTWITEMNN